MGEPRSVWTVTREAFGGRLPDRYEKDVWNAPFRERIEQLLTARPQVLDVGGGAQPSVPIEKRPPGTRYVGLDIAREELERAPSGSYDEEVVADLTEPVPELRGSFDLAVSWLVLEHVRPIDVALENIRSYLRPGGTLVFQVPGGLAVFALLNRIVPHRLAVWLLARLTRRAPESVFPAHYDRCSYSALARVLEGPWATFEIRPLYTGAGYFGFSRLLRAAYIAYEEWIYRNDKRNLAPYYLVTARSTDGRGPEDE